jgi:hypothetical protein
MDGKELVVKDEKGRLKRGDSTCERYGRSFLPDPQPGGSLQQIYIFGDVVTDARMRGAETGTQYWGSDGPGLTAEPLSAARKKYDVVPGREVHRVPQEALRAPGS